MYNPQLEEKLNNENMELVTSVFENVFNDGEEVTYEKNEDGDYIIYKEGKALYAISSENKVGDVIGAIVSQLSPNEDIRDKAKNNVNPPRIKTSMAKLGASTEGYRETLSIIQDTEPLLKNDFITGELKRKYNELGDNTASLIGILANYINNITSAIYVAIETYNTADLKNLAELQKLVDGLFGSIDQMDMRIIEQERRMSIANGEDVVLSIDEYFELYGSIDEIFEGPYSDVLAEFQQKMQLQYIMFKSKVEPQILDNVVENLYASGTQYEVGTEEWETGLQDFKEYFGDYVFNILYNGDIPTE